MLPGYAPCDGGNIGCHEPAGDARGARGLRRVVLHLPRRPARAPGRAEPAQRLPRARRRHRHEHGAHARVGGAPSSADRPTAMAEVCRARSSHGSLMGARGNSGVILSQILRGLADTFARARRGRGADVVAGAAPRRRRRVPGGAAPGRGHDPHRRPRAPPRRPRRARRDGEHGLVGAARRSRGAARTRRCSSTPDLLPVLRGRRRRRRRRARASSSCSTRSSRSSPAGRSPSPRSSPRRWRSRPTSRGDDLVVACATR